MSRYHTLRTELTFVLRHPWIRRGFASALVILVLSVALAIGYWRPVYAKHEELSGRLTLLRGRVVKSMQDQVIARTYARTKRTITRLDKKLNAQSSQAALVNNVTSLAQNSGVQVISESYEEGKQDSGYIPLFQVIALKGEYKNLRQFLLGVQKLPTWTVVQETRLERPHEGKGIKATLTLVTYRKINKQISS